MLDNQFNKKSENSAGLHILLTGGGTAGHVMPHLALYPKMKELGWRVSYVGTKGMEKALVESKGIPFYVISAGKLRRYFSWQNFLDIFRLLLGLTQSAFIVFKIRPDIVFSKGGFVSVPISVAAWLFRIPVLTHESDLTPGLANKILARFSKSIFYSFPETASYLPRNKAIFTGLPIRQELFKGEKDFGLKLCDFKKDDQRPILLFMGGSQGAQRINSFVRENLGKILLNYRVLHLCGKGKIDQKLKLCGYWQKDFAGEELKHLLAISDYVISRAGANSIYETLALKKPMILIPLSVGSRGDQVLNAQSFKKQGLAEVIEEDNLEDSTFFNALEELKKMQGSQFHQKNKLASTARNANELILSSLQAQVYHEGKKLTLKS